MPKPKIEDRLTRLEKLMEEVVFQLGGSAKHDFKGLVQKQKEDDKKWHDEEQSKVEFRGAVFEKIEEVSKKIDAKFQLMEEHIDNRFIPIEERQKRQDLYLGIISNSTTWKITGVLVLSIIAFGLWMRGGYELIIQVIRKYIL